MHSGFRTTEQLIAIPATTTKLLRLQARSLYYPKVAAKLVRGGISYERLRISATATQV